MNITNTNAAITVRGVRLLVLINVYALINAAIIITTFFRDSFSFTLNNQKAAKSEIQAHDARTLRFLVIPFNLVGSFKIMNKEGILSNVEHTKQVKNK